NYRVQRRDATTQNKLFPKREGQNSLRRTEDTFEDQERELEMSISHNDIEVLVRPGESEASGEESGDMFDELEYESEEIPGPAIYLAALEEIPMLEKEKELAVVGLKVDLNNLTEEERIEAIKL
ncbi:4155_t:CDS:2, partial [Acaulospora morrowiae]